MTRYDWGSGLATSTITKTRHEKTSEKEVRIKPSLDIPSLFLMMRAQDLPVSETRTVKVLNGDTAYEVTLTPVGKEQIKVAAGTFEASRFDVGIREVPKDEPSDETRPVRYRSVHIWVAETSRMPLKLEAQISVGSVYAELVRYKAGTPE